MALYDPNEFPETEVTQDFTLADVLAWARTKPADEGYDYCSNGYCAIAQFLSDTGRATDPHVDCEGWSDGPLGEPHTYDPRVDEAAVRVDWDLPKLGRTFGLFAKRLESALA